MPTFEEIHEYHDLLQSHRHTLAEYLQQQEADVASPGVEEDICEEREIIAEVKATLRQWGVMVDDNPIDTEPADGVSVWGSSSVAGDVIHAEGSQGFVNRPTGPVQQHFGDVVRGDKISGDINVSGVSGSGIVIGHSSRGHSQHGGGPQAGATGGGDPFAGYEAGLEVLMRRLGREHPRFNDVLVFEQRLRELLVAARRYGDTETLRAERATVIDRLNELAQETLGVSFNALCG
jgi:hypothetical protein